MTYEMAMMVENGEMPDDWYRIAHDERELAAIIEEWHYGGGTINKDTPAGSGFTFGRTESGKWYFATDEFLDDDEERAQGAENDAQPLMPEDPEIDRAERGAHHAAQ